MSCPIAAAQAHSITSAFKESTGPSLNSMTSAMGQLKALQARYLAQGDTKLAASLGADIKYLSGRVDAVRDAVIALSPLIGAIGTPTFNTYRSGERGDTPVVVTVSARQNTNAETIQNRYGPTAMKGGAQ